MASDPATLSATELLRLYRRKQLSPVETTQAVLDRIERFDPAVNAFCLVDRDQALQSARASEARWQRGAPAGLLDGIPATIKDLVLTRGWPTLRGSLAIARDQAWDVDAPATARLREQGAVLIGKTTTPEFGWKAVTDSALTGITRNPWDTSKTPGGSSGGAAAACALGMGALHIGTDGGGSIRIPASFSGIFGLKPSFGRVPAWPLSPFGTVAHLGPMTRTVSDAALMLNVLALPDRRDWFALPYDSRDYQIGLEDGVGGLRVAFSPTLGFAEVDARSGRPGRRGRQRSLRTSAPGSSSSTRASTIPAQSSALTGRSAPPTSSVASPASSARASIRDCRRSPAKARRRRSWITLPRSPGGASSAPGCAASTRPSTCC